MIYKSVEYSVWCDLCDNLTKYEPYKNKAEAIKSFKKFGWKMLDNDQFSKWSCPKCNSKNTKV